MPIYEYECLSCHTRTEVMQRFSDPPLSTCGDCGGELRKLISAPAFQFKGEGWYVTDYARKGNGSGKKDTGAPAAEAKSSDSSSSSESKSSTKESSSKPEKAQAT